VGANRLSDRRRRDGAAVWHGVAATVDPHFVRRRGTRFHQCERAVRHRHQPRPDDPLPRDAGVLRRGDHAERMACGLREIPRAAAGHPDGDHLDNLQPFRDDGPGRRRLSDRYFLLALAVPRQHRAWPPGRDRRVGDDRYRQARFLSAARFRRDRPCADGDLSRLPPIRARGGTALGLARRQDDPRCGHRLGRGRQPVLLAGAKLSPADRRSARFSEPQLCARQFFSPS